MSNNYLQKALDITIVIIYLMLNPKLTTMLNRNKKRLKKYS